MLFPTFLLFGFQDEVCSVPTLDLDLQSFKESLPQDPVTMRLVKQGDGDSYWDVTIAGGTPTFVAGVEYDDWCIDTDLTIARNTDYTANVYSSYDLGPYVQGLVEYPDNLPLVNYIINQGYVGTTAGCGGEYTYGDVQRAIWELVEDNPSTSGLGSWVQCRVLEILADARADADANGRFVPDCGDVIGVILVPIGGSKKQTTIAQVTLVEGKVYCSLPLGTPCDDGDSCTEGEACDGDGNCVGGTQRNGYYLKCGRGLFLCNIQKDEIDPKANGYDIGGCNTGSVRTVKSLGADCMDEEIPDVCDNRKGLSNYGFAECIPGDDGGRSWGNCDKEEVRRLGGSNAGWN